MANKECPECAKGGHDKTKNHLFLMADGKRWCCLRSDKHESGEVYYEDANKKEEEIEDVQSSIDSLIEPEESFSPVETEEVFTPSSKLDGYRGIKEATYKKFGVKGETKGKSLISLTHSLLRSSDLKEITTKTRKLPKKFFVSGSTKDEPVAFFGQHLWTRAKRLLITEGELDALSAYQMLDRKYRIAVVSLPFGANIKPFIDNKEWLKGFKELYISVDNDEKGKAISKDIASLHPSAKFLSISCKDANEMLQEGRSTEYTSAFWDAEEYKPEFVVRISDVKARILERPTMGVPWPWPTLTEKTYGRNDGQGIYVGAGK